MLNPEYSHVLKEFTDNTPFQATFGQPQLEFICNHDVILRLIVEKATFKMPEDTKLDK